MMLWVGVLGIALIFSQILAWVLAWRYFEGQKSRFFEGARAYFESPDGKNPSPFAGVVEVISEQFAGKMVASLKSTFMGVQSGDNRGEKGLIADIAQDVAFKENPLLASVLTSFPAVAKRLRKNPELLPLAQGLLARFGGSKAPGDGAGGTRSDYGQRLAKYR